MGKLSFVPFHFFMFCIWKVTELLFRSLHLAADYSCKLLPFFRFISYILVTIPALNAVVIVLSS
jgi:hypothetical protein